MSAAVGAPRRGLLGPGLALFLAVMACARSDVPVTVGIGSGGLAEVAPPPTSGPIPTEAAPADDLTPTLTPTAILPPASPTSLPTPTLPFSGTPEVLVYEAQPGDSLPALAARFGVTPLDILSQEPLPDDGSLVDPGQFLFIPRRLGATGPADRLMPDSEVVFSPHAVDFDVDAFVQEQGGFLAQYEEYISGTRRSGSQIVAQVARDNSVNPRLLLALLEHQSGWVTSPVRPGGDAWRYPLDLIDSRYPGLFRQLTHAANELGNGYYGWRAGTLIEVRFPDDTRTRIAPEINAGTVALQHYFSTLVTGRDWAEALSSTGFIATYRSLFGSPWGYTHPLFEPGVTQPPLELPFLPGHTWSFTGGPHGAWERESAWAAVDFAPSTTNTGCEPSLDWAVAAAPGLVVRSGGGVVVLDLDGDGREQSGWALVYLHIAPEGRVETGMFVEAGDLIGHPSCEGGVATGTHLHIVRKYNGEWILADGPIPFELGGWRVHGGARAYEGYLTRGDSVVVASPYGTQATLVTR